MLAQRQWVHEGTAIDNNWCGNQIRSYLSEVSSFSQRQQMREQLDQRESRMLGLLHRLPLQCPARSSLARQLAKAEVAAQHS
jgi:hypothetical protein